MTALPDPANSAVVLVGSAEYSDRGLSPLPAVTHNLEDLASLLTDADHWGVPPTRCVTITNPHHAQDVLEILAAPPWRATDTLMFYYSGHGLVAPQGELILATRNTRADLPTFTGLPYASLREVINRSPARRRIVILDCCFSGRAIRAMSDPSSIVAGQVEVEGSYVLTSSPANSPSLDTDGGRHTGFTGGLLSVLRTGIPEAGFLLSLDEIYERTLAHMCRLGHPRPQRYGTNLIGSLAISRNRARGIVQRESGVHAAPATTTAHPVEPNARSTVADLLRTCDAVAAQLGGGIADVVPPPSSAGSTLVASAMEAVRESHGDGGKTTAALLGALVRGLHISPDTQLLAPKVVAAAGLVRRELAAMAVAGSPAVWTAAMSQAGHEVSPDDALAKAVRAVGPANVRIAAPGGPADMTDSFTFSSRLISPHSAPRALILPEPVVVTSRRGTFDVQEARRLAPSLLVLADSMDVPTARILLRLFTTFAVVRPSGDAAALLTRTSGIHRAEKALVLSDATVLDGPTWKSPPRASRKIVPAPKTGEADRAARHMLSAARSAAHGTVPGGGRGLSEAARRAAERAPAEIQPAAQMMCEAAWEVHYRLQRNLGAAYTAHVADPWPTVGDALMQAAASAVALGSGP